MKTILVADDNEHEVKTLISLLQEKYTVEYVSDGKQALERIAADGLDAAVLDREMPPSNTDRRTGFKYQGAEVAKSARAMHPNLALVLRCARANEFVRELKGFEIYCHEIWKGDQEILNYLQQKLGE